ncbi:MAG: tRNA (adenosine(37)-N6)-threonylcarbamoyltransferase complex transferase subunit TsaD [Chloroflexi bacterium]|nr:tRNA (adenosine(37)-N6)-threonylcarbamoyltransferase complex transferase subunit TsaD [Chloroflexota bacterium]
MSRGVGGGVSPPPRVVLSVETSCDETGVAIVEDGRRILSNVVASQTVHERTGGIVPEVAAREHLRQVDPVAREALARAGMTLDRVDAVAATVGPGLIGALLVGANYARGLAFAAGKPFVGVNHLEGHVYANWLYQPAEPADRAAAPSSQGAPRLAAQPPFPSQGASPPSTPSATLPEDVPAEPELPAVVLVVSGAHSDLVLMEDHRRFRLLGRTIDDAAGEAYDKVARLLGLGFPGGPLIERAARDGDAKAFPLPKADLASRYDVSFSGLKTAVLRLVRELERRGAVPTSDVAASFQRTINEMLAERVARAAGEFDVRTVMLGGGVAANLALREEISRRVSLPLRVPPPKLCIDNGAMIGAAAYFSMRHRAEGIPMFVRSNMTLAH